MWKTTTVCLVLLLGTSGVSCPADDKPREPTGGKIAGSPSRKSSPEQRALDYLTVEVSRWPVENKCFSCHNNGDGARALYRAIGLSYRVDKKRLAGTTDWLSRPKSWKNIRAEGLSSDKELAGIQFAAALAAAVAAGQLKQSKPLVQAAEIVAASQQQDGSWSVDADAVVGSPVTYGRFLATAMGRGVLIRAGEKKFQRHIARSEQWFLHQKPRGVLNAAAVLMALARNKRKQAAALRGHCLQVIRSGQAKDGGWGPFVSSPPESFDTAVVLLALSRLVEAKNGDADIGRRIRLGRRFLVKSQLADGSWPPTTRPANAQSYAQQLSTTGWATLALLETRPRPTKK